MPVCYFVGVFLIALLFESAVEIVVAEIVENVTCSAISNSMVINNNSNRIRSRKERCKHHPQQETKEISGYGMVRSN